MGVAVYVPLLAALPLGLGSRPWSRLLPPATAARAVAGSAVLVATATSFVLGVLGVLAFTLLGRRS